MCTGCQPHRPSGTDKTFCHGSISQTCVQLGRLLGLSLMPSCEGSGKEPRGAIQHLCPPVSLALNPKLLLPQQSNARSSISTVIEAATAANTYAPVATSARFRPNPSSEVTHWTAQLFPRHMKVLFSWFYRAENRGSKWQINE